MEPNFKFNCGDKCREIITGLEGIVMGRIKIEERKTPLKKVRLQILRTIARCKQVSKIEGQIDVLSTWRTVLPPAAPAVDDLLPDLRGIDRDYRDELKRLGKILNELEESLAKPRPTINQLREKFGYPPVPAGEVLPLPSAAEKLLEYLRQKNAG